MMHENELNPEQRRQVEALAAEFEQQLSRVGVDLRAAHGMHEISAPIKSDVTRDGDHETYTETHTVDVSGIVATLRTLPNRAGTSAFVTAYNETHSDWRDALWRDPARWNRWGSYTCAEDPRLMVRQRGAGWTLNMGHPKAQVVLWGFLGVVIAFLVGFIVYSAHTS